uniref:Angiotensin-converting enzyme n=1 Tax=Ciona savignyi TaxID=51511 RepID=H2Z6D6_CIOSA
IYSKAKVCRPNEPTKCLMYEPGIINLFAKSRNYSELLWAWKGWRDAIGPKVRTDWERIIEIENIGARENNYTDEGAAWRTNYQVSNLRGKVEKLWAQLRPFYLQLHSYVRYKLKQEYGDHVNLTGPIPAHLLGEIWAMSWLNIYNITKPYPNVNAFQVDEGMKDMNYTTHDMFVLADNFYQSMGLPAMPDNFWKYSMFTRPKNRSVVCYASASDMGHDKQGNEDVRIKMCAVVNANYLYTVHHEMGHCQYYLAYNEAQPPEFRAGANNGFHEAIGDTAALSVINPTHLKKLGILKPVDAENKHQQNINFLLRRALEKVAFFPFSISLEFWRWDVFSGKITNQHLNAGWWENKLKYQGIYPPVERTEHDFDPASKYHVTSGTPYIRYFIAHILEFQLYETLCKLSGHKGPLHLCDFQGSKVAGRHFRKMLEMGNSKHWEDILRKLSGSCHMDAGSTLRFFKPLTQWLKQISYCHKWFYRKWWFTLSRGYPYRLYFDSKKVARFLRSYQYNLDKWRRIDGLATFARETNITKHNTAVHTKTSLEFTKWLLKKQKIAAKFSLRGLSCDQTRMIKSIRKSSSCKEPALRKEKVRKRNRITAIYSKAKVCRPNEPTKCLMYEPGIINLFAKSRNYGELLWAWKGWRDAIGPKVRTDWERIIEIENIGARENGYTDEGAYWRTNYQIRNLREQVEKMWAQLRPLYLQLHSYVRYKLKQEYGDHVNLTGPIPAHLLGEIWAMSWLNIYNLTKPYPNVNAFQVDEGLKEMNYTTHDMFVLADNFYQSMGLPAMPDNFWKYSMFTRPKNRSVVCYASAWNMGHDKQGNEDVRVKMCAVVNANYLYTVHHEMGHCQYYLAYNEAQPPEFRAGANNGFHEAIGDTAALSVINPTHLKKLGILKPVDAETKHQQNINFLLRRALEKVAFFPFSISLEFWRWDVFSGKITNQHLNAGWWENKLKYQGIYPPVERTEHDFDPASKYHVTSGTPYIRYFIAQVLEFQFYEILCKLSGHKGPLHLCDFQGSKVAGRHFRKMLEMGNSKHWEDILQKLSGSCHVDAGSTLRFFKPLTQWLVKENKRLGNKIGW